MTRQRRRTTHQGMTLVEVLIGTGLLVGGGGALLAGMCHGFMLVDFLSNRQVALHTAQGKLEELATLPFDTLASGAEFSTARTAAGLVVCAGEDANCNGKLDAGEVDVNRNGRADRLLTNGKLNIRIRPVPVLDNATADFSDPDIMLDVSVAASWRERRRCIGGEDRNCNSILDPGEDVNRNGWLETPVVVSTRVVRDN